MSEKNIGKFIANKRKEKGLTQQELGDKLYVTDKAEAMKKYYYLLFL